MVQIKIFGTTPPCANCKRAEKLAQQAAEQFPGQVEVIKLNAMSEEAQQYGLVMTPLVVVGDEVVGAGRAIPPAKLIPIIQKHLQ
ncbi:MAG: thioredoxin family protein [Anaerolineae bacterium]